MFMYVLGVWDYLRGPVKTQNRIMTEWLSAFFSEALEPQKVKRPCNRGVTKMKFLFFLYTFEFSILLFVSNSERQRELVWVVQLFLLFFFFFCICTVSALFVRLCNLLWKRGKIGGTAWFSLSSASLSCHPIPLPTPPALSRMKAGVTVFYIELFGRALQLSNVQSSDRFVRVFPRGTGGLLCAQRPRVFVTKNPRSRGVWSAGVSSRVGRGESRSTSQSSLCLDW